MFTATAFAKILGPYCLIIAAGVYLNLKYYQDMLNDIAKNKAIVYIAGIFALMFGLFIVTFNNVWGFRWPVLITLLGWMGIIKGIVLVAFPNVLPEYLKTYQNNASFLKIKLIIVMVIGIVLTMFGYFR